MTRRTVTLIVLPPPDVAVLKASEVAAWLGVKHRTVQTWALAGRLPSFTTLGGHRRFQRTVVAELAAELGITRPARPSSNGDGEVRP